MKDRGWFPLCRNIIDDDLYCCERFSKGQAWIDLLLLAGYKDNTFNIRGNKINLKRGQLGYSIRALAKRWKWNRRTVNKFLLELSKCGKIQHRKTQLTTIITILNYDEMQNVHHRIHHRIHTNNKRINKGINNNNNNVDNVENVNNINVTNNLNDIEPHPLQIFVKENCPNISKLSAQLTIEQCKKIISEYNKEAIKDILLQMENKKDLSEKYTSVYLTMINWLKREKPKRLEPKELKEKTHNGEPSWFQIEFAKMEREKMEREKMLKKEEPKESFREWFKKNISDKKEEV